MVLQTNFYSPFNKQTGKRNIINQVTNLDKSFKEPVKVNGRTITMNEKAESLARDISKGQYFSHRLILD